MTRSRRKYPLTFDDIRRAAEERLVLGMQLDFEQIMLDIAGVRTRAARPRRKSLSPPRTEPFRNPAGSQVSQLLTQAHPKRRGKASS
jgi:hypothetical protein